MLNSNRAAATVIASFVLAIFSFGGNVQKALAGEYTPGSIIEINCPQTKYLCTGNTDSTKEIVFSILSEKVFYKLYGYERESFVVSDPLLQKFLASLNLKKPGVYSLKVDANGKFFDIILRVVPQAFSL